MPENENKLNQNEETTKTDFEIEPLSEEEMDSVAGGAMERSVEEFCSVSFCS